MQKQRVTAVLTGQGMEAGKTYILDKLTVTPNAWGVVCTANVRDEDFYPYRVNSAHIMFDLDLDEVAQAS